jgi:cell fate (sporulation/competence/biofilm development) regulator YlbF (YheA/YmcA/DUF963 family)
VRAGIAPRQTDLNMIDQKAKELGRLIGQSDQYKALKRSNDGLGADKDSVTMLRRMEELRTNAQRMIEAGEEPTAEMEREMDELLGRVQVNASYQQAVVAQENFDKLMMQVNNWIAEGIKSGAASPIITLS